MGIVWRSLTVLVFGFLGCAGAPELGDDATPQSAPQRVGSSDVTIDLRACSLIAGKSTPVDAIALFGEPFATGWNTGSAGPTTSLVYLHHDPETAVPDMVYFMFQQTGYDPEMRLAGAVRTTNSGVDGFTCFRDSRGNLVPPLHLNL
jgi:hypothetical protein